MTTCVDLSRFETKVLFKELFRRFSFRSKKTYADVYQRIAARYGVVDENLIDRFFLEIVPGFSPEEQAIIETELSK